MKSVKNLPLKRNRKLLSNISHVDLIIRQFTSNVSSCIVLRRRMSKISLTFATSVCALTTLAVVPYVFLLSAKQITRNSQETYKMTSLQHPYQLLEIG